MQTLDKTPDTASAPPKSLSARMGAILKWCDKRCIGQVYAFFRGCDPSLDDHEARIRLVIRTTHHTVTDTDERWIQSMEATIAALGNRKHAA